MAKNKSGTKMKRLSDDVLENGSKIVVLGDVATDGAAFAICHLRIANDDAETAQAAL